MANANETVQLEHLNVQVTRKPGCTIQLEMNVDAEAAKAAYNKALRTINKEVNVPGFRKGKAPDSVVIQQFGKYIQKEWQDILANTSFKEFLAKTQLYPFTNDRSVKKVEVKNLSLEGAQVSITYEATPEVPKIDHSGIQLKKIDREPITQEEIDETIHQIQLHHADWQEVKDRPIQEGDFVSLTIDTIEQPSRSICKDLRFEVAEGKMGNWLKTLLLGKNPGDTVEGMSEKDDNLPAETDFKPTLCRIHINKHWTAQLPPIDDALAGKVGVSTLEELRPRIEQDLNRRADAEVQDQIRAQVEEYLLKTYPFDIPASLVEAQKKEMLNQKVRKLSENNEAPEAMTAKVHQAQTEIDKELDRAYRLFFLSRKVAEENGIQVYEREIMNEMMRQLSLPQGQGIIDPSMNSDEARSKLFVNVLSQKVLDFLASKATGA